jgi:hypothetical protein
MLVLQGRRIPSPVDAVRADRGEVEPDRSGLDLLQPGDCRAPRPRCYI